MATSETSLPYHEPGIVPILILTSYLLLSNILNWIVDKILYCGLIGQILLGIAWGTPGGKWLDRSTETTIVNLGYLGLILLVYEGGLSTSFQSLKANLLLSVSVALTGIVIPIGLSFSLGGIADVTPLQSFAAGAALCSTSLGTTFTVLGTTGLLKTRLGVVLTSAAMLDDVVGLVMVQVISNLGGSGADFQSTTVIRPVFVSVGFALVCPLLCWLLLKPLTLKLNAMRESNRPGQLHKLLSRRETAFVLHMGLLIGLVTGATYAGTSNLFAAYVAGAVISWWDSELPHVVPTVPTGTSSEALKRAKPTPVQNLEHSRGGISGVDIYEHYLMPANDRILKPFFFTSIGFSIPITRMFDGAVVWRGIIYSILMLISKLICGVWLIRIALPKPKSPAVNKLQQQLRNIKVPHFWGKKLKENVATAAHDMQSGVTAQASSVQPCPGDDQVAPVTAPTPPSTEPAQVASDSAATKPFSLYPGAILGLAMVSRGEIGFLISSLAESNGIFTSNGDDSVFLIVTWAIVLCTIIGPVGVGLLVRRVKRLERARLAGESTKDPLGVWGVE